MPRLPYKRMTKNKIDSIEKWDLSSQVGRWDDFHNINRPKHKKFLIKSETNINSVIATSRNIVLLKEAL